MMNLILLAQTRSGATTEIVIMLVVAAIIGFITAWLYYRSLCNKKLADKNAIIEDLEKQIKEVKDNLASKNATISGLEKDVSISVTEKAQLDSEIEKLKKELKAVKALPAAAVKGMDGLKIKNKATGNELKEKDEVLRGEKETDLLTGLAQRKHKIDYSKMGVAHAAEADDLTIIKGIGHFIQAKLNALDIYTFKQISNFTPEDIKTVTEIIEFFPGRINRDNWVAQAKELISK